jgi:transmembrane sensor
MQYSQSVHTQAIEWVARELSGSLSPDETTRLARWLEVPEHRQAYDEVIEASAAADPHGDDLLAAHFEAELHELAERERPKRAMAGLVAMAATLVLTAGVVAFYMGGSEVEPERFATAVGDTARYTLEDGSTLTLNTASRIEVAYLPDRRALTMAAGEIFFDVARAPDRPFTIDLEHGTVTVTGTAFNIDSRTDRSTVSVVSGAVDVRAAGLEPITLLAGQEVTFGPDMEEARIANFDPTAVLSWRQGRIRFEDAPLSEVTSELNRYFQRQIVLGEGVSLDAPVTGEFDVTDQELAIRGLSVAFSLEPRREPGRIVLLPQAGSDQ